MANARMSIGAIFGAIQASAATITSTLDAANKGIGMVNKTVSDAAERQEVRSTLDTAIFKATLHQEKAKELATSRIEIQSWLQQSKDHAEKYESAYNELAAVLNPSKA